MRTAAMIGYAGAVAAVLSACGDADVSTTLAQGTATLQNGLDRVAAAAPSVVASTSQRPVTAALVMTQNAPSSAQDLTGCAPMRGEDSALDVASLRALGRSAAPNVICRGDLRVYGSYTLTGGKLFFERSRGDPYPYAEDAAFREAMGRYGGTDPVSIFRVSAPGGPILAAGTTVDGARCLAFDLYGPRAPGGGTLTAASGLLCATARDPFDFSAYLRRVESLAFTHKP